MFARRGLALDHDLPAGKMHRHVERGSARDQCHCEQPLHRIGSTQDRGPVAQVMDRGSGEYLGERRADHIVRRRSPENRRHWRMRARPSSLRSARSGSRSAESRPRYGSARDRNWSGRPEYYRPRSGPPSMCRRPLRSNRANTSQAAVIAALISSSLRNRSSSNEIKARHAEESPLDRKALGKSSGTDRRSIAPPRRDPFEYIGSAQHRGHVVECGGRADRRNRQVECGKVAAQQVGAAARTPIGYDGLDPRNVKRSLDGQMRACLCGQEAAVTGAVRQVGGRKSGIDAVMPRARLIAQRQASMLTWSHLTDLGQDGPTAQRRSLTPRGAASIRAKRARQPGRSKSRAQSCPRRYRRAHPRHNSALRQRRG